MGRAPTNSLESTAWSGAYTPSITEAVYGELWRLAETVVRSGRPVVIDASFRTVAMRDAARELAQRCGVPFVLVECVAPRDLTMERLAAREKREGHESDARTGLLDEFERHFEPIEELAPSEHIRIDTSRPHAENRERLEEMLAG
jgi:predicted kinase